MQEPPKFPEFNEENIIAIRKDLHESFLKQRSNTYGNNKFPTGWIDMVEYWLNETKEEIEFLKQLTKQNRH